METLQIEINEALKAKAMKTLAATGLSLSDALDIFINELAEGRFLSTEHEPNKETAEILKQDENVFPMNCSVADFIKRAIEKS